ncbi:NAD(P)H-dependent FMN reductase [Sulfolobales archaeon HS-7]|nr:NAD(P)H-dependent FMN reductase [Sulfolobales archaeon HS-7]
MKVLGIVGSLRKNSYNMMLFKNAQSLAPEYMKIELFERLGEFPLFNQDLESDLPEVVRDFKRRIREADALLFVTPEYNYSVPGVLKNAIDWASRPYNDNVFDGKVAGIMSASIGMIGGERAQLHLRQIFTFLNITAVNRPEVIITFASKRFDEKGVLLDDDAKKFIKEHLENLASLAKSLRKINSVVEES